MEKDRLRLAALVALMSDFVAEHPTPTEDEEKEFAKLEEEYEALDKKLKRLEKIEAKMKYLNGTDDVPLGTGSSPEEQNERGRGKPLALSVLILGAACYGRVPVALTNTLGL